MDFKTGARKHRRNSPISLVDRRENILTRISVKSKYVSTNYFSVTKSINYLPSVTGTYILDLPLALGGEKCAK